MSQSLSGSSSVVEGPTGIYMVVSATSAMVLMTGKAPRTPSARSEDPTQASPALEDRSTTVDRGEVVALSKSIIFSLTDSSNRSRRFFCRRKESVEKVPTNRKLKKVRIYLGTRDTRRLGVSPLPSSGNHRSRDPRLPQVDSREDSLPSKFLRLGGRLDLTQS